MSLEAHSGLPETRDCPFVYPKVDIDHSLQRKATLANSNYFDHFSLNSNIKPVCHPSINCKREATFNQTSLDSCPTLKVESESEQKIDASVNLQNTLFPGVDAGDINSGDTLEIKAESNIFPVGYKCVKAAFPSKRDLVSYTTNIIRLNPVVLVKRLSTVNIGLETESTEAHLNSPETESDAKYRVDQNYGRLLKDIRYDKYNFIM